MDRRTNLAVFNDFHHVLAIDRLILEEGRSDLVQGTALLDDDALRAVVLMVDQLLDLGVDSAGGFLTVGSLREISRPRKTVS